MNSRCRAGAAASVLQTGLENLNLIVHPAIVLPNVGMMERARPRAPVDDYTLGGQ
jgi:hypothetical protein